MIGRIALSSKLPCDPAKATAVSLPITWMPTITTASSWVGFTLPGMIDEPGSLAGQSQLVDAGPRPAPQPADVVGDLIQRHRQAAERGARRHHRVERADGGELVPGGDERMAGELGDSLGDGSPKSAGAVMPVPTAVPPGGERVEAAPSPRLTSASASSIWVA